ncbi:hypothetical protein [Flammeovirga sp. SubArs3]|uniref:hypothetical protein n=1 Tax=Flammeovirga sp. SubArs3 TaxID=2995316 RepID=UPI00248C6B23|nr:hypothetical protein [Flammeovirga sp. SubArs3]
MRQYLYCIVTLCTIILGVSQETFAQEFPDPIEVYRHTLQQKNEVKLRSRTFSNSFHIDSTFTIKSDSTPSYKSYHKYDNHGNLIEETRYRWKNYEWEGYFKQKKEYDHDGRITEYLNYSWINYQWELSTKQKYEYVEGTIFISKISYFLPNNTKDDWYLDSYIDYVFDQNLLLDEIHYFRLENNNFDFYQKVVYSYFGDNEVEYVNYIKAGNNWDPELKVTYQYIDDETYQFNYSMTHYFENNQWKLMSEVRYEYDEFNNNTSLLFYGEGRVPQSLQTYTYDNLNNKTKYLSQYWDVSKSEWLNSRREDYIYNDNQYIDHEIEYTWKNSSWSFYEKIYNFSNDPSQKFFDIIPSQQGFKSGDNEKLMTIQKGNFNNTEWLYKDKNTGAFISFSPKQVEQYIAPGLLFEGEKDIVFTYDLEGEKITSNQSHVLVAGISFTPFENIVLDKDQVGPTLTATCSNSEADIKWYYGENSEGPFSNYLSSSNPYNVKFYYPGKFYLIAKAEIEEVEINSNSIQVEVIGNRLNTSNKHFYIQDETEPIEVFEYPNATSREWRYRLDDNDNWKSFDTPQTSETFNPEYLWTGEYQLACFSTINDKIYQTEDITITFTSKSVISPIYQKVDVNEVGDTYKITESPTANYRYWYYSTKEDGSYISLGKKDEYAPLFSEPGKYYIKSRNYWNSFSDYGNIVEVEVFGNAIDNSITTSILVNSTEQILEVSEYPIANQREWFFRLKGEIYWNSFQIPQTNSSLVLNFNDAGSYELICKSNIENKEYTSNIVSIDVIQPVIITNHEDQIIDVNTLGTLLEVEEQTSSKRREWWAENLEGTKINLQSSELNYSPFFSEIGEYEIYVKSYYENSTFESNRVLVKVLGNDIVNEEVQYTIINVPTTEGIAVQEKGIYESRVWKYQLENTNLWSSFENSNQIIYPEFANSGTYQIACFSTLGNKLYISDTVKVIVVDQPKITPNELQNIEVRERGNELSILESYPSSSKKWYYSDRIEGPYTDYVSGSPTYAPYFYQAGNFFILCKVKYGDLELNSDTVQVRVNGVGLTHSYSIYSYKDSLTGSIGVTEYPIAESREWKWQDSSNSKNPWNSFDTPETSITLTPYFDQTGRYKIACFSTINSQEFISDYEYVYSVNSEIYPNIDQNLNINEKGNELEIINQGSSYTYEWRLYKEGEENVFDIVSTSSKYTPQINASGIYYVEGFSKFYNPDVDGNREYYYIPAGRIKISIIGNTIKRFVPQTLLREQEGKELKVTEYPIAERREWKYKKKGDLDWISFEVPEYTEFYTPTFKEKGNYVVTCFSSINNIEYQSNEIDIDVIDYSIVPNTKQTLELNKTGELIELLSSKTTETRYWYYNDVSTGENVYLGSELNYLPLFDRTGEFEIFCSSVFDGQEHTSNKVVINVIGVDVQQEEYKLVTKQSGLAVFANEVPVATSREWKYRLKGDSQWLSFSDLELNEEYIPYFEKAGNYEVACHSVINSVEIVSNILSYSVNENEITPREDQHYMSGEQGKLLLVNETNSPDERGWYYINDNEEIIYITDELGYTPEFSQPGKYEVYCNSTFGNYTTKSNSVKITVIGLSIDDQLEDTLVVHQEGKVISITEYPTASTREWKYRLKGSETWLSFIDIQTDFELTPIFNTVGDYEITCHSIIQEEVFISDPVQYSVNENYISPTEDQQYEQGEVGNKLTVNETNHTNKREWYYTVKESDEIVLISNAESYIPDFSQPGTYEVYCNSTFGAYTTKSNTVNVTVIGLSIDDQIEDTLVINQEGKAISITEFPIANSREWKYRVVGDLDWNSFENPIFENKLNPIFSKSGDYEITCHSLINGTELVSNVVTYTVNENEITPSHDQQIIKGEAGEMLSVNETNIASERAWYYTTVDSEEEVYLSNETNIIPSFSSPGIYEIYCISSFGNYNITSNKVNVTVIGLSIDDQLEDTLVVNQKGKMISVNEYPKATSREWKYREVGTIQWNSFDLKETAETYYPIFYDKGQYEIICHSIINNDLVESNIISYVVASNAVFPEETQNIEKDEEGKTLSVELSHSSSNTEWFYTSTTDQKEVFLTVGDSYRPHFEKTGEFYVFAKTKFGEYWTVSNSVLIIVDGIHIKDKVENTLVVGQEGKQISVSESKEMVSRMWYTKLFGSDVWVSTGVSSKEFIPLFDQYGSYELKCISMDHQREFESEIVVYNVEANEILSAEEQVIKVGEEGSVIEIYETSDPKLRGWYYTTSKNIQSEQFIHSNKTLMPLFDKAGEYFVFCKSQFGDYEYTSEKVKIIVEENVTSIITPPSSDAIIYLNGNSIYIKNYNLLDASLYDVSGRRINYDINTKTNPGTIEIRLKSQVTGIIIMKYTDGNSIESVKLLKD